MNQNKQYRQGLLTYLLYNKNIFTVALFTILWFDCVSQNAIYIQKTRNGEAMLAEGYYGEAAESYSVAFQSFNKYQSYNKNEFLLDCLNAARAWSMVGKLDSAYFYLLRISSTLDYGDLEEFNADKYLQPMRQDERWPVIYKLVEKNSHSYENVIKKAKRLLKSGNYFEAAKCFSIAFQSNSGKEFISHRLDAARAWSMAGNLDSAYINLMKIAEKEIVDMQISNEYKYFLESLNTDKNLEILRRDERWLNLVERANDNYLPSMPDLASKLKVVFDNDQLYRLENESIRKKFGSNSIELKRNYERMKIQDSINLNIVTGVLEKYGWLGIKDVGLPGNTVIFLVIHHASLHVREKYLPMMREAVKMGNAKGSNLALFEDRILINHGKKQIYGSQFMRDLETGKTIFSPIEDVDNVDKRRALVGLGPLSDYAEYFGGFIWDAEAIEKNKKALPPQPTSKE